MIEAVIGNLTTVRFPFSNQGGRRTLSDLAYNCYMVRNFVLLPSEH